MRSFLAFFKKELMESARSGKFMILGILFFAFGVMNPAIAKLTPWLLDVLSESLAESGMTVTAVTVDALTSWTQFFKNIPMALIAFVLLYGGIFTKEYESGTLILVLTKGLARSKVVLAKALVMLSVWTGGYWLCFAVTYVYNAYYWDNGIAVGLAPAALNWWLFGIFTVCLCVLFSVLSKNSAGVLLGTGTVVLLSYVLEFFPKLAKTVPTALMQSAGLTVGAQEADVYTKAVVLTAVLCVACLVVSVPILNKKQL
jgi:ABC-2 type transport system permease protein